MKEVTANKDLVANCGLYCGACGAYLKERCPGCRENVKAKWCKIRTCCGEQAYASCAECKEFADPNDCRQFNSLISRLVGLALNSNRRACVLKIREIGLDGYAAFMAEKKRQTLPRRGSV
jgi:hypothetical protein